MDLLKKLVLEGIAHKGFAFIDILQICATFFPVADYYSPRVYELSNHNRADFESARTKAREWDYNSDTKIALGTFFERSLPSFDEKITQHRIDAAERARAIQEFLIKRT
jgi:2-oxoglutarate ferredoxin oxidoreductase subunit beta